MTSMYRAYALTMTRPHEKLGLRKPIARELAEHSPAAWTALLGVGTFLVVLAYIATVAMSSARGFQLRDAERRVERLQSDARELEMQVAKATSIGTLTARAGTAGFVAADHVETVNAAGHSYALAR